MAAMVFIIKYLSIYQLMTNTIEQQNKNTRAKTTRHVKLLTELLRENHEQRNPEDIEAKVVYYV